MRNDKDSKLQFEKSGVRKVLQLNFDVVAELVRLKIKHTPFSETKSIQFWKGCIIKGWLTGALPSGDLSLA